ncbi:tRNA (adenosine(37)-N6)-threonylcarbamoyltransferase complex ATPase subunit type 1 TsaE [Pedobacter cryoconitis]|uniref:tRNA threonylcarbamoyladenosine biosynthesis protein TsaE n=1 Tax=Pedobacter cryoconitis TaxID=188932 RepID=A0A327T2M6_9SPHI|nr:tRNA (adenosine(37)-N6)-threonylcarbamoyltransferase complex ATPase subunit type 1 TsaE [Pedobacter cryoconitis]RAJ34304.1 tRNA threonylcarbamoyladenosine biosynthesis protein TsaE [Pedobacter cryoconitis]
MNIEINHLEELGSAAEALLSFAGNEKIFAFEGEMGAGKTTFIKVLCQKLGVTDVVNSPTFSIVNEYAAPGNQVIYHFDFYRIKNLQEVFDIGYEEYFYSGNICLIEWPQRIAELLPETYIEVEITALSEDKRSFTFTKIS